MLLEIYITMIAVGFVLMGLSFFTRIAQHEIILIPFLAAIVFLFLGFSTLNVIKPFCEPTLLTSVLTDNTTSYAQTWSCYKYLDQDTSMAYLFYGLGLLMLGYAIFTTIGAGADAIEHPRQN